MFQFGLYRVLIILFGVLLVFNKFNVHKYNFGNLTTSQQTKLCAIEDCSWESAWYGSTIAAPVSNPDICVLCQSDVKRPLVSKGAALNTSAASASKASSKGRRWLEAIIRWTKHPSWFLIWQICRAGFETTVEKKGINLSEILHFDLMPWFARSTRSTWHRG